MYGYQNIQIFFAKDYVSNWSEEVFVIKKVKAMCCGHMLVVILMERKSLERFTKKYCKKKKKKIKKSLEFKK